MLEMMLKSINKKKSNQKGFTLVELIVVVAILGILAAVAVPRFGGLTKTAKLNADYAAGATIASAVEAARAADPTIGTPDGQPTITELNTAKFLDKDTYKSQSDSTKDLTLTYTTEGNPVVTIGTGTGAIQVFPK